MNTRLDIKKTFTFAPHSIFVCYVWFSKKNSDYFPYISFPEWAAELFTVRYELNSILHEASETGSSCSISASACQYHSTNALHSSSA
jgi:hypothetical protein